jgi:methylenetetrahydrofolate reductase (NADPH)
VILAICSPALVLSQYDDQRVKDYGISLAVKMIRRLVDEGGLNGFHFCTLNLEKSVQSILETLGWTPSHAKIHNKLIAVSLKDET